MKTITMEQLHEKALFHCSTDQKVERMNEMDKKRI